MRRALGYALSTLVGPWAFLVVLGVDAGIAAMRGSPYVGEGMWTVRWMAIGLWMLWPVAAAVAAVDAGRLSRPGSRHLVLASRRGWRRYPWAAAWTALPMAVGHALVTVSLLLYGGDLTPRVGWAPLLLAVLAQAVTFVFFACLGSFIGRHLPVLVAGIVAAAVALVAGFTLTGGGAGEPRFEVLGDAGATVSQIGVTWNLTHLLLQIGILGGLSVLLVVPRPQNRSGLLAPSKAGLAAALSCFGVLLVAPSVVAGAPLTSRAQAPDSCVWSSPVVCYYPEHERYAGPTVATITELVDAAKVHGYDSLVPERVEERSRRYDAADGVRVAAFDTLESHQVDVPRLVQAMVTPTWCPQLRADAGNGNPVPDVYVGTLLRMIGTWSRLVGEDFDPTGEGQKPLTPAQMATARAAFARCDLTVRL